MNKIDLINRAAFLVRELKQVEDAIKDVTSINNVNGLTYERLERNSKVLLREDFIEAKKILVSFLNQRILTREQNYIKELDNIKIVAH
jgi:hypothetical protein